MLCACLLQSDLQRVCPPVAGLSVLPLITKTFLRRSTAACSYSPVRVPSFSLRQTSDFIKCFVEVADPRLHQVPSRQSVWTFMNSSMRLDVTRVCLQRASVWMKTSVFGCIDDGVVVLLVRAQFIQDVRNGHSMLLAVLSSL